MSYVFSGTSKNAAAIEEWVKKIRRGTFSSLYSTFGADVPVSLDDVTYLTQTDVKVIARWDVCSGKNKGPQDGGFYFAWTLKAGRGHALFVRGLRLL